MDFFKLVRFPNLIIVLVIQAILEFKILRPAFLEAGIPILLNVNLFALLVMSTILIAATGYIINDIMDVEIDKINKPEKMIIGKVVSIKHAWQIYYVMVIFGFIISLYVAWRINNLLLVLIYPIAIALLALYSIRWKKTVLFGNLIVALFSAMVTGIVLFAERASFDKLRDVDDSRYHYVAFIFFGYILFSFLSSLYREVVKDIEDVEGDTLQEAKTIPVVLGTKTGKRIALFFAICTLLLLAPWIYHLVLANNTLAAICMVGLVLLPLLYSMTKLLSAKTPSQFHNVSTSIKVMMAGGIISLIFF